MEWLAKLARSRPRSFPSTRRPTARHMPNAVSSGVVISRFRGEASYCPCSHDYPSRLLPHSTHGSVLAALKPLLEELGEP